MNETKQKGLITELQCELAFTQLGITVCAPLGEDSRYDYIVDVNGNLLRIQCKTCSVGENKDYISFATRSTRSNTQMNIQREYTKDEIDYFYTYYDNHSYLVPVEECSSQKTLRFTSEHIQPNMSWAEDYELETVLLNKYNFSPQKVKTTIQKIKASSKDICPFCGGPMEKGVDSCRDCYNLLQRKVADRPTCEEIIEQLWEHNGNFTQVAKLYSVTDNAVRKWLKAEGFPTHSSDYKN